MTKRRLLQLAVLLLGAAAFAAPAGIVLTVDNASGAVGVDRLGTHLELKRGDPVRERDLVNVGADGKLSLTFADHGFIEIGPDSEIAIEKLPFASYADDLKSIFTLTRGYLRVVWRLPPQPGGWPLFVYFGSQHAALSAGEYFFDDQSGAARACVAAGQLSVLPDAGTQLQQLGASACYRFVAGLPPEKILRDPSAWIAVRRGFSIDAPSSPEAMLAAGDDGSDHPGFEPSPAVPTSPPAAAVKQAPLAALPKTSAAPKPSVAAAVPPPAAGAAAAGSGAWDVNVVAYPKAADADHDTQKLRAAGYAATVEPVQVKGHAWFRVRLRGYPTADAARAVAGELQSRFAYRGVWVNKIGPASAAAPK